MGHRCIYLYLFSGIYLPDYLYLLSRTKKLVCYREPCYINYTISYEESVANILKGTRRISLRCIRRVSCLRGRMGYTLFL